VIKSELVRALNEKLPERQLSDVELHGGTVLYKFALEINKI